MKKILIIWSSSGVGLALWEYYKTQWDDVISVTRDDYNLSNIQDIQKLSQDISQNNYDLVIYSAGVGYYKKFWELSSQELSEQIFVNTLAPLEILRNSLKVFQKNNTKFVYLSSIMRHIPAKNMSVYAGMKQTTSQTLNTIKIEYPEINILNIDLGAIQTPMHQKAGLPKTVWKQVSKILPKLVKAIDTKQGSVTLLWEWKFMVYIIFPILRIFQK